MAAFYFMQGRTLPIRWSMSSRRRWRAPFSYCGLGVKPSVQRLSGDECPCRVMVLSAVGVSRRMMVSEAPASW